MTLRNLEAKFLKRESSTLFRVVDSIGEADGVEFLCPKCFAANGNSNVGTHVTICWAPSVPQDTSPTPGRWNLQGTSIDDLSLVAGSSSILMLPPGCGAHFFVEKGAIRMA